MRAVGNRDGTEKSPYMPFQISFLHAEGLSGVRNARVRAGFSRARHRSSQCRWVDCILEGTSPPRSVGLFRLICLIDVSPTSPLNPETGRRVVSTPRAEFTVSKVIFLDR